MNYKGRAIAFIDEANISIQADEYLKLRIDWKKLLAYLNENYNLLRAYLYTGLDITVPEINNFIKMLKHSGYRVVQYRSPQRSDGTFKANLDVHMAVDMVSMADRYDTAILFSGDGDFIPVVNDITRRGVQVNVVSLENHTSRDLIELADNFRDLKEFVETEQLVFQYNDRKKAEGSTDDYELSTDEKDAQAVMLIQEILKSLPLRVFPVPASAIEKRALQLDSDHNIAKTSFTSYRKLLNELDGGKIILTSRKDGMSYIENVDFEALDRYITRTES